MWRTPYGYSPPTLSQKPPLRRRKYQRTRSGIPPTQRQWRKRNHGSLKPKPPETGRTPQSLSPEEQHLSTGNPSCCTAPPQDFHRSTFSFSESKTNKTEKASLSAEGKSRFVKFLCRADKISAPTKVRWLVENLLSARGTPHPQGGTAPTGHQLSLSGYAVKRQPAANGWAVAPTGGRAKTNAP